MNKTERTPVTIITGFLGAGKTSLLNQIISENPNTKFAVIENEFGEIGIDNELVIGAEAGIFEMTNGCICCTLNGDLSKLLEKLVSGDYEFDHLVIETTGIADPAAVAASFVSDYNVQQHFELNAIIGMVDAKNIEAALKREKEAALQISYADVLIFNKKDLVTAKTMERLKTIVRKINPFTKFLEADFARVNTTELLGLKSFDHQNIEKAVEGLPKNHDHQHEHITSQSFTFDGAFDLLKFRHFVQVLLTFQGMRIYRMKGILNIHNEGQRIIFQAVQKQTILSKGTDWEEGEERINKLVVIGNNLDREAFEKRLQQCLVRKSVEQV